MPRPSVFCDLASRRRFRLDRGRRRLGGLDGWFGQLDVRDGSFRRVARNGGIIADGGQPAGIDAFDRLSRR